MYHLRTFNCMMMVTPASSDNLLIIIKSRSMFVSAP